jgi:hypothetical protein
MVDEVLKDSLEIKVDGETYEFAIPSYLDEIRIGVEARDILRSLLPSTDGFATTDTLDNQTNFLVQNCARFKVLLRRSSAKWPWSSDKDGKPMVDPSKAIAIGVQFGVELGTFRNGGLADSDAPSSETMAGQPDPQ